MAVDRSALAHLEPIAMLSQNRLHELSGLCYIEKVSKDIDPFRMNVMKSAQAMYLLSGDLGLAVYRWQQEDTARRQPQPGKPLIDASAGAAVRLPHSFWYRTDSRFSCSRVGQKHKPDDLQPTAHFS